jgi:hypothetical protein
VQVGLPLNRPPGIHLLLFRETLALKAPSHFLLQSLQKAEVEVEPVMAEAEITLV